MTQRIAVRNHPFCNVLRIAEAMIGTEKRDSGYQGAVERVFDGDNYSCHFMYDSWGLWSFTLINKDRKRGWRGDAIESMFNVTVVEPPYEFDKSRKE